MTTANIASNSFHNPALFASAPLISAVTIRPLIAAQMPIGVPRNYFPNDDPSQPPLVRWRGHANLLFANWINYYVYQETPYDLNQLPPANPPGL